MKTVIIQGREYRSKRYKWEELADMFPHMWVVLDKVKCDSQRIISGVLINAVQDEDKLALSMRYKKEGKTYSFQHTGNNSAVHYFLGRI